ncbi:MAG: hypothetical protein JO142_16215 [Burkholderiales bacterium]|nr:hypothetical protein [Burkholderiales bacterium]
MIWFPIVIVAVLAGMIAALAWAIVRFHGSLGEHHLRGRYTWAEELDAIGDTDHSAADD